VILHPMRKVGAAIEYRLQCPFRPACGLAEAGREPLLPRASARYRNSRSDLNAATYVIVILLLYFVEVTIPHLIGLA